MFRRLAGEITQHSSDLLRYACRMRTDLMNMQPDYIEFPGLGRYSRTWLQEHQEQAQKLLTACHGHNPLCLCRDPPLPLYISQRTKLCLARLPNTGPRHAPGCPSYETPPSDCGRGLYSTEALEESGNGQIRIRLDAPLQIRPTPVVASGQTAASSNVTHELRDRMQLKGLLHLLWERSELARWHPAMLQRRRYRQLYKFVLNAARDIHARGNTLADFLCIPEPYDPADSLGLEQRRQRMLKDRSRTANGTPLRILLLGQIREVRCSEDTSMGIILSHWPPTLLIRMTREQLTRLRQTTEFAWVDWPCLVAELRLIVLLLMQRSHQGHWEVRDLVSMVTTTEYVPVHSFEEAVVARELIRSGRQFNKPLPYDGSPGRIPNFLLCEGTTSLPLEILTRADKELGARKARIASYQDDRRECWIWDTEASATPPPLARTAG